MHVGASYRKYIATSIHVGACVHDITRVSTIMCIFVHLSWYMHEFWCFLFSACVLVHSFMLKLVFCCWNVGVTCVHVVLCALFLAFWFLCVHSCRA